MRAVQAGAIAAGSYTSCVLRGGGKIGCWGAGDRGQLGNGATDADSAGAQNVTLSGATGVAFGAVHGCAVLSDSGVSCWGADEHGQQGNGGAVAGTPQLTPSVVAGLTDVTAVTAMSSGACALHAGGTVSCWGDNDAGETGQPLSASIVGGPQLVAGLSDVVAIDAGWFHVCAVKRNGTLWCWGYNGDGQVGQPIDPAGGAAIRFATPTQVPGITDAVAVSGGVYQSCVVHRTGGVSCFGANVHGEAGTGAANGAPSPTPQAVTLGSSKAVSVSSGEMAACALLDDGAVTCWGQDASGQLGNDATLADQATPQPVHDLTASAISFDFETVCALSRSGGVDCWGNDAWSSVGNGPDAAGIATGPSAVLEATSRYARVAAPTLGVTAPATLTDSATGRSTITVTNPGPDVTRPEVHLTTGGRLAFSSAPAADSVEVVSDHASTWRPGELAVGASATVDVSVVGVGVGDATVDARLTDTAELDPRRPLGVGPLAVGQFAGARVAVAAIPTQPVAPALPASPPTTVSTPAAATPVVSTTLVPLEAKLIVALAKPKQCVAKGTNVAIKLTPPPGLNVSSLAVVVGGKTVVTVRSASALASGTLRLDPKVARAFVNRRGKASMQVTVKLGDGRSVVRTFAPPRCR